MGARAFSNAIDRPRAARPVPATIKRLIWEVRVRQHECCEQNIAYFLEREYHVWLSVPKI
jgi:hypothetical protein